jgi:hypothetical protein
MAISKSEARRLTKNAAEIGAEVLRGTLTIGPAGAAINGVNLADWLARHDGIEMMLIATPVGEAVDIDEVKTCPRCGRDYKGDFCPYCAEARARLRG